MTNFPPSTVAAKISKIVQAHDELVGEIKSKLLNSHVVFNSNGKPISANTISADKIEIKIVDNYIIVKYDNIDQFTIKEDGTILGMRASSKSGFPIDAHINNFQLQLTII